MVAGDLVNTASRVQAVADAGHRARRARRPRRASEAAIVYEDAGTHELKGKAEPVPLWRAVRVVGLRGGERPLDRPRAPVRRPRPRAAARQGALPRLRRRGPRRISSRSSASAASASPGSRGSSRSTSTGWRRTPGGTAAAASPTARASPTGRSPRWCAGDAGILEDEDSGVRARRSSAPAGRDATSPTRRSGAWSSRGSRTSSGSRSAARPTRRTCSPPGGSSSSAWPRSLPIVLVFEDIHWADSALLDFVEYLLEWSRRPPDLRPHARPAGAARPATDLGRRQAQLHLALPRAARRPTRWKRSSRGLVPGLPDDLRSTILERAEGVPLYAVETVRMLLDRGAARARGRRVPADRADRDARGAGDAPGADRRPPRRARPGGTAPPAGRLGARQDVHAARARRADRPRGDGARAAPRVARAQGDPVPAGRPALARARPVRLPPGPRQEGRLRHALAEGAQGPAPGRRDPPRLASTDEDEIVEVVAAHYLDAYRAAPDDADAADVRVRARTALDTSGRAGRVAGGARGGAALLRARGRARRRALPPGRAARAGGRDGSRRGPRRRGGVALRAVVRPLRAGGPASPGRARLGTHRRARLEPRSRRRRHRAHGALVRRARRRGAGRVVRHARGAARAVPLLLRRGRRRGRADRGRPRAWRRRYDLPEVLSQALNTKALTLIARERRREGVALLRHALEIALDHELPSAALRAYYNLADVAIHAGRVARRPGVRHERACACTPGGKPLLGVVVRSRRPIRSSCSANGTRCST